MLWGVNGLAVASASSLFFNSGSLGASVAGDVAIRRNAAGTLEVNSGTSGALATIKVSDSHVFDSAASTGVTEGIFQAGQAQSTTPIIAVRGYHATLGTGALIFSFAGDAIPQWGTIAEPTCNSANRGKLVMVQGGAGVQDTFRICRKDAADAYAYVSLY